jgi:hypothetical protein
MIFVSRAATQVERSSEEEKEKHPVKAMLACALQNMYLSV